MSLTRDSPVHQKLQCLVVPMGAFWQPTWLARCFNYEICIFLLPLFFFFFFFVGNLIYLSIFSPISLLPSKFIFFDFSIWLLRYQLPASGFAQRNIFHYGLDSWEISASQTYKWATCHTWTGGLVCRSFIISLCLIYGALNANTW